MLKKGKATPKVEDCSYIKIQQEKRVTLKKSKRAPVRRVRFPAQSNEHGHTDFKLMRQKLYLSDSYCLPQIENEFLRRRISFGVSTGSRSAADASTLNQLFRKASRSRRLFKLKSNHYFSLKEVKEEDNTFNVAELSSNGHTLPCSMWWRTQEEWKKKTLLSTSVYLGVGTSYLRPGAVPLRLPSVY